jgi:methyl-accepting chemotaxis protein
MMRYKDLAFKYKLFLVLVVLILVYAISSFLFINFYLKNVLQRHSANVGHFLASSISLHIVGHISLEDTKGLEFFLKNILKNNPEVSYIYIENDKRIIVSALNKDLDAGLLNNMRRTIFKEYVFVETKKGSFLEFSEPIFNRTTFILKLGISDRISNDIINRTLRLLLYSVLSAVAAALLFSIVISRKLMKPLSVLTSSAIEIANGNYSKLVEIRRKDEAGRLADGFNRMVYAVKIREKELREINEELEIVNVRLHEYINELNRTKDELVRSKQDAAVVETSRAVLHHMRQPLTYLIIAIDMLLSEINEKGFADADSIHKNLRAVEEAGNKLTELLKKFENLKEYKSIEYVNEIKIIDIDD